MPKFFVNEGNIDSGSIVVTGEDVNHIRKVLRLNTGDRIILCDGNGNDYLARIEKFQPDSIVTGIISIERSGTEPPIEVTLFQGIPKSDKMDFIIQKSVELGVRRVVPVITERTVIKINGTKDAENKIARWRRISLEAAKQCNRGVVPQVDYPVNFKEALELSREVQVGIIPYEKEHGTSLKNCLKKGNITSVAVMIGPEGGFSEEEIQGALLSGLTPVTLGPRILRTETAAVAVLSILMYELGDIGGYSARKTE